MRKNFSKSLKIISLLLVLTLALSFTVVRAYDSPLSAIWMIHDLTSDYTSGTTYNKNTVLYQSIYNKEMFTVLTNPCTNCVLQSRVVRDGNINCAPISTTMKHYGVFEVDSAVLGNYKLERRRADPTLLKTASYGTWYINEHHPSA